ncbi:MULTISPECIES: DNA polymerase IV [Petrimonas]|jgi:DNA polymerase-4|nr:MULTISPECIES: DNA polymerase IV [Petrimonas]MDD3561108.1 DNA polymerase IV [Petrimonas mucosa]HHT29690.1 DNA polymerase IV [Petrimonas mucosa]
MIRKIIHIDMDAFYASIEQRDNPEYRGKPVAVGYGGKRGVVAAASYEARQYGIHSAMPSVTALRRCPRLIFVAPRFENYKTVSNQIMQIFREYTDKVEPLSLDEAFLDVTVNKMGMEVATQIAKEIKEKIHRQTLLTASAGVSYNKFLAKIASDYKKPDGLYVITPEKAERFLEKLAIEKFFGVGRVTAQRMHELGIRTGYELKRYTETELVRHFGKAGTLYYQFVRGIDEREVESEYVRKSLGAEETFAEDLHELVDLLHALDEIAREVHRRAQKRNFLARTLTLKIKYADFTTVSRSRTVPYYLKTYDQLFDLGKELLLQVDDIGERSIRLMGLTLKNASNDQVMPASQPLQLSLDFRE